MTTNTSRPLSPHLQIYKLPLTGLISITHRITGVFLSLGLLLVVYIFYAVAGGRQDYVEMQALMGNGFIRFVLLGALFALFFHLSHGVRHLIWDSGKTFDKATLNLYAVLELIVAVALTGITLIGGYYGL